MMFATAFVGVLDLASGILDFVNAGHNPPLLRRGANVLYLPQADNTVLGVMENTCYPERRLQLESGDLFLLYTDGVTEAMNGAEELFSEERLKDTVSKLPQEADSAEVLNTLRDAVRQHADGAEQSDDLTLLALRY